MLQQTVPGAVRILPGSDSRLDIIVHLNIAHAIVFHQTPDHAGGKFPHLGIAVIQLIPGLFPYALSMAHKKPLIRLFLRQRTV